MATTPPFKYQPMFEKGKDTTEYYLLTKDYVSVSEFEGKPVLKIEKEGLTAMANAAFRDVSFMLRRSHNEQVAKILSDPEASDNDKSCVMLKLPRKACCLSARIQVLPLSTVKKDSRYGRAIVMKKLSHWVCTRPIPKRTCAILKMLLLLCTMR